MAVTKDDLQDFHEFADRRLSSEGVDSLGDLVKQWEAARQPRESHDAIREAIEQMERGEGEPLDVAMADIRQRLGLPE